MDMTINQYSMLRHYGMDLQSCHLSPAVRKRHLQDIPGADGQEDLMKGMGPPSYETREFRATFKMTGSDPRSAVDLLVADIEGETLPFSLPGDPEHYMIGDFHIVSAALSRGSQVVISATCQPWRYFRQDTRHVIPQSEDWMQQTWRNLGRRVTVPRLQVTGEITISTNDRNISYPPGEYDLPELLIPGGDSITVTLRGGPGYVTYKEAIL